jgi:hypothetical protein
VLSIRLLTAFGFSCIGSHDHFKDVGGFQGIRGSGKKKKEEVD